MKLKPLNKFSDLLPIVYRSYVAPNTRRKSSYEVIYGVMGYGCISQSLGVLVQSLSLDNKLTVSVLAYTF